MKYQEAIEIIKTNFPDKKYSMLREALTTAIIAMENASNPTNVQMHALIVNGETYRETLNAFHDNGWVVIHKDKAKKFHPYALDTDTILFFAKPIHKEEYDQAMALW